MHYKLAKHAQYLDNKLALNDLDKIVGGSIGEDDTNDTTDANAMTDDFSDAELAEGVIGGTAVLIGIPVTANVIANKLAGEVIGIDTSELSDTIKGVDADADADVENTVAKFGDAIDEVVE